MDEGAEEEAEQVEVGAVEEAEQADEGPKQVNEAVSEPQGAAAGGTVAPTVPAKKADAAEETPPVAAAAIDPTSDGSAARGMKRKAPADTSGPAATATATSTAASSGCKRRSKERPHVLLQYSDRRVVMDEACGCNLNTRTYARVRACSRADARFLATDGQERRRPHHRHARREHQGRRIDLGVQGIPSGAHACATTIARHSQST